MKITMPCALCATLALSACNLQPVDLYNDAVPDAPTTVSGLTDHTEALNRVDALPTSSVADVTSGTASFAGSATVVLFRGPTTETLFGDATLEANFDAQTISGSLDSFVNPDNAGGALSYGGGLTLSDGVIAQSGFDADFSGLLRADSGDFVQLDGSIDGTFKGGPVQGLVASGQATRALVNGSGTSAPAIVSVVAETP